MNTNVVLYRRFSSDEQESGDSLTRQSRTCEAFAKAQGWIIGEVLTDRGRSAYKGEHLAPDAALGGFIARLAAGEIEPGSILLAERLDRLSRRPVGEAISWLYGLTSRGLSVAVADKGKVFTSNMTLEDVITLSLSLAQGNEESAKKSERITSAKQRLWGMAERKEGAWTNLAARVPLWLGRNAACDGWIIDDARAEIVRDIYQWSADGLGAVTIASRLNAVPVAPWGAWRKKEGWGRTAVRQLLNNPAVEGDFVGETGMFAGRALHGFYPRIVDADVVAQARAQQRARKKAAGEGAKVGTVNLFAGLSVCGQCGGRAAMTSSVNRYGTRYKHLRCEGATEGRCINTGFYAYQAFETKVLDLCLNLALDDRFFAATGDLREAQIRVAELEKAIATKRTARGRLMTLFVDGDDMVADRIQATKAELDELAGQLEEAKADVERASGKVGAVEHLKRVNDIREAAMSDDEATAQQARAKLRQAFSAIVNSLEIDVFEGRKVLTLAFLGGVLAVRFDTKGKVIAGLSEVGGHSLADYLSPEQRALAEPLIRRIQAFSA